MEYLKLWESFNDDLVKTIKVEMLEWYRLDIHDTEIKKYINDCNIKYFDTIERENCADYFSKILVNMKFPRNRDSDNYKKIFYQKIKDNSSEMGVKYIS